MTSGYLYSGGQREEIEVPFSVRREESRSSSIQ
jgi:hypothetical protein